MTAHLDIAADVLTGLLTAGSSHHFSVVEGLPAEVVVDDVTYNPFTRTIRLHFDRPVNEPILRSHRRAQ